MVFERESMLCPGPPQQRRILSALPVKAPRNQHAIAILQSSTSALAPTEATTTTTAVLSRRRDMPVCQDIGNIR